MEKVTKNGTATVPELHKNGSNGKTEIKKNGVEVRTLKTQSIKDVLEHAQVLQNLTEKYETLKETKSKLTAFIISSEDRAAKLELRDDMRNDFTTSNPVVLSEVLKLVKEQTNTSLKKTEEAILNFSM